MSKNNAAQNAAKQQPEKSYKMLEVTISGHYKSFDKEMFDFEGLKVTIPFTSDEHAAMHVRGRYVDGAIKAAKKENGEKLYPKSIEIVARCYIDDIKVVEGVPSFVGKDIKTLDVMEMQDLATAYDLRTIPLPKDCGDKRAAREKCYKAYREKVLQKRKMKPDVGEEGFNFAKLEPIILDFNGGHRIDDTRKLSNDAVLELEGAGGKPVEMGGKDDPKSRLSLDDLKKFAEEQNIEYDDEKDDKALYNELYGKIFG